MYSYYQIFRHKWGVVHAFYTYIYIHNYTYIYIYKYLNTYLYCLYMNLRIHAHHYVSLWNFCLSVNGMRVSLRFDTSVWMCFTIGNLIQNSFGWRILCCTILLEMVNLWLIVEYQQWSVTFKQLWKLRYVTKHNLYFRPI